MTLMRLAILIAVAAVPISGCLGGGEDLERATARIETTDLALCDLDADGDIDFHDLEADPPAACSRPDVSGCWDDSIQCEQVGVRCDEWRAACLLTVQDETPGLKKEFRTLIAGN
ncbi:MAG: hypothetical protein HYY06_25545 [Deltaproteobacteria bacterium]|nr:hypothetical protein [Deltaproteobacteria bacterium]